MGQYLTIGVAKTINIKKDRTVEKETILDNLRREIDLEIYDYEEDDEYIMLNMKKEIFEAELPLLIKEITKYINKNNTEKINLFKEVANEIKGKNEEEMMQYLSEEVPYDLHLCEGCKYICNSIHYIYPDYDETIFCDLVELVSDGKIIMETTSEIFSFIRSAIIGALKSKIRSSIMITIYG